MEPISIIIPVRIESEERGDNLRCAIQYLLRSPFVWIDILEAGKERLFHYNPHERIRYRFIRDDEPVFYKTHYLNLLLKEALYPIVGMWDADVIIPEVQLIAAIEYIRKGCFMCYPYDGGCRFLEKGESEAIRNDINTLQPSQGELLLGRPSPGGAFLVNGAKYLEVGAENEGFYGWGPEDAERIKRMEILELPVARVQGPLYHLYHSRIPDKGVDNEAKFQYNQKIFLNTCKMTKSELIYSIENCIGVFSYLNKLADKTTDANN